MWTYFSHKLLSSARVGGVVYQCAWGFLRFSFFDTLLQLISFLPFTAAMEEFKKHSRILLHVEDNRQICTTGMYTAPTFSLCC